MKFDMDYIAHHNELTETNPYFKLFLTIILLIVTLALDNLCYCQYHNRHYNEYKYIEIQIIKC